MTNNGGWCECKAAFYGEGKMTNNGWDQYKREVMSELRRQSQDLRDVKSDIAAVRMTIVGIEGRVNQASDRSRVAIDKANEANKQINTIKIWVLSGVLGTLVMLAVAYLPQILRGLTE